MNGRLRRFARCLAAALLLACATAQAHETSMAELELRELAKGQFSWAWGQPGKSGRPLAEALTPRWPANCRAHAQALECGAAGLSGQLRIDGVGKAYSAALVRITWLDGQTRVYTLTAAQPEVLLHGAANDGRGAVEVARAYTVLGIEHIFGGADHLLFVFSLLLLVGFRRRLVWTITAFTLAHSITLASSALGWLTLRAAPVEAVIALSIVLVAAEALHTRDTLARRWPALVSFLFGLVHGLGFAGALRAIGLPEQHVGIALLGFNLGVEAGQLAIVGLAYVLVLASGRHQWLRQARRPALYAIGAIASYWSLQRIVAIFA